MADYVGHHYESYVAKENAIKAKSAVKNDAGKERFDLLPHGPLFELARVYTLGGAKYGDYNWTKGMAYGRIFAAMMRHA